MANLVKLVKLGVEKMSPGDEDIVDTIGRLDEIESRRDFRNLFAHWAAKRIVAQDALILFSQDLRDVQRATGGLVDHNESGYCLVNLADIRGLVEHLIMYERWIAERVAVWHARYIPPLSS